MSEMMLNSEQLKAVLKGVIVELLHENRQELSDFLAEIIEDIAMERAIGESEASELVSQETIFQLFSKP